MDALITTKQAAAIIGMHPGTLAAWRKSGIGPRWRRVGRKAIRYLVADIMEFVDAKIT